MGKPLTVVEKPASMHGYIRFETNRWLTGMGHERYLADDPIQRDRPPDRLARRLFETGKVEEAHVYGQSVTVRLCSGCDASGLKEVIEDLYTYYRPGVEVPTPESFGAASE